MFISMKESFNNKFESKTKTEEINKFIDTFVVERNDFKKPLDKVELFEAVKSDWYNFLQREDLITEEDLNKNDKDLIESLCEKISSRNISFAPSTKIYELLPEADKGLECLSASIALASILDKRGIKYDFISPAGHIALSVELDSKNYYIDPINNKSIDIESFIIDTIPESENFDIVKLKENKSGYSFFFKYKNKEDIMKSVFGNIIVMNDLNHGKVDGSANDLAEHERIASLLKNDLDKVNFEEIKEFVDENYDSYYERNEDLIKEEENRVYN